MGTIKISEDELVSNFCDFLVSENLIDKEKSHFKGDDESHADIELVLKVDRWQELDVSKIYIEAKSHHSKDSQNTINKIFGQLLKETGKRALDINTESLAVLFPFESADWPEITKCEGIGYYQRGFKRIDPQVFVKFGELVGVKYVFVFKSRPSELYVFKWKDFLNNDVEPILTLTSPPGENESVTNFV